MLNHSNLKFQKAKNSYNLNSSPLKLITEMIVLTSFFVVSEGVN